MRTARHVVKLRRRLAQAFSEHLALKILAVVLALMLWFLGAAREPTRDVVGVRFSPQLDSALVLRDPAPPIRAQVVGRANEILKLSSTPLVIRRSIASDVPDTLILSLRPSDVEVPEGVDVIVTDVAPHSLMLRFETITNRRVPVRSAVVIRPFVASFAVAVRLEPDSVTVSGPRLEVLRLTHISTLVDSIAVDTLPHLVDLDTAGLGVVVRPAQVKALVVPIFP